MRLENVSSDKAHRLNIQQKETFHMKKKIIVACGGAVATSMIAAKKVEELCRQHGIEAEICQLRISEVEANLEGTALIVATVRAKKEYGVPLVSGMPFITGIGAEEMQDRILGILGR